jgi:hypothetical protein
MPSASPRPSEGASSGFEIRAVTIGPGGRRGYDETEWRDALVFVRHGEIELESLTGVRCRFERGDVLCLAGLPLRALHSRRGQALLVAVFRSAAPITAETDQTRR